MVKNRIRALLTQHSIELPKLRDLYGKLDRFALLFTGFLFDDLTVALLQARTLVAFLRDGLLLVRGAGGAPVALRKFSLMLIKLRSPGSELVRTD